MSGGLRGDEPVRSIASIEIEIQDDAGDALRLLGETVRRINSKCEHSYGKGKFCRRCGRPKPPENQDVPFKPACWIHRWKRTQWGCYVYRLCEKCERFQRLDNDPPFPFFRWTDADKVTLDAIRRGRK